MWRRSLPGLALGLICTFLAPAHEEAVDIGRSAAGQLRAHFHFPQPLALAESVFPGFPGFATGLLGIHSVLLAEPDEDLFPLDPGADLRLVLVSKDPGLEIGNNGTFMIPGDMVFLGQPDFDNHPLFNLRIDAAGQGQSATFFARDVNGIHPDSEPFTLSFSAPPRLTMENGKTGAVILRWSNLADDYVLETAGSLDPAVTWTEIPPPYTDNGTQFEASLPKAGGQGYFRLRKVAEMRPARGSGRF